jgi:hypothetical protein
MTVRILSYTHAFDLKTDSFTCEFGSTVTLTLRTRPHERFEDTP